jgi:prepilin-type N-terminal cleavage/methylation domain-containing protein
MSRRRGFTFVEMAFVLSILGILATLAVPRIRGVIERGQAAALHERVYSVRLAYEAAGAPRAEALRGTDGVLPTALASALNANHFRGEGGVTMRITGQGPIVFLVLKGDTETASRVRTAFHRMAKVPHLLAPNVVVVPLSPAAIAQMPPAHGNTGGNVALGPDGGATTGGGTQPPITQPPVTQPPVTQPPVTQPPVTQPPVTQPPVTQPPVTQPPVTQPPVTQPAVTQSPVTQPPVVQPPVVRPPNNAPVCSSSLPPGLYRQCTSGTSHGPPPGHGNPGHGNPHNGGWFRN